MTIADKVKALTKNKGANYVAMETMYQMFGEPDVMIGKFIPLYNVIYYDSSVSQDVVKFRAVGAQFLAHQLGHNEAFRVDCEVTKEAIGFYLTAIESLFRYGQGYEELIKGYSGTNTTQTHQLVRKARRGLDKDEYFQKVSNTDYDWIKSVKHQTFNILTREMPVFSCYLETYSFQNSVEFGKDVYKIVLLLRKYIPPDRITEIKTMETEVYGEGKLVKDYDSRFKHPRLRSTSLANKLSHYNVTRQAGKYISRKPEFTKKDRIIELMYSYVRAAVEIVKRLNKSGAGLTLRETRDFARKAVDKFHGKELLFDWDWRFLT